MNNRSTWTIDPTHSEIIFKVKHLMITNVKGEFRKFDAKVTSSGNNFSIAKVAVSIDTASIFTNNDDRDNHLRSADFFEVEKFPEIKFESTAFEKLDEQAYKLTGILTIREVSKEITLDVEFGGVIKDPWGNDKAGFSVSGTINRRDWGLNWNAALEAGGVLVSEEVRINAEVQFVRLV